MVHNTKIESISSSAVLFPHFSKIKKKTVHGSTSPRIHESMGPRVHGSTSPVLVLYYAIYHPFSIHLNSASIVANQNFSILPSRFP